MQIYNLQKNPLKESKILQVIITLTNLKIEITSQKSSFKSPLIKIDLLPRGQNPLSYYTL